MKHTKNIALLRANNTILLIYLVFITNALIAPVLFGYNQEQVEDSVIIKIAKYLPIIIYIILNYSGNLQRNFLSSTGDKLLALISLFYFISTIWSPAKSKTILNSLQFFIFIWFFNLVFTQNRVNIFKVLKNYLIIIVIASWFVFLIFPHLGRMDGFHNGLARGVFMHKNVLGATLVLLFPILLRDNMFSFFNLILIFLTAALVFFTGSSTSIISISIILLLIPVVKSFKGTILTTFITVATLTISFIFYQYSEIIFNLFGKSDDLTGRALLWEGLIEAINKRPYLGWGYFGFWESNAKAMYLGQMEWVTGKAHNAFIDLLISGGYLLLAIAAMFIYITLKNLLYAGNKEIRSFCLLSFFSIMVLSLTEINLFVHNNLYLFVLMFLSKLASQNIVYTLPWHKNPNRFNNNSQQFIKTELAVQ